MSHGTSVCLHFPPLPLSRALILSLSCMRSCLVLFFGVLFMPPLWYWIYVRIFVYLHKNKSFWFFFWLFSFLSYCQMMRLVNYIKQRHSAPIKNQEADYGRHSNLTLCSHPPFILHLCLWPWFPFFSYPQASVLSLALCLSIYLISFLSLTLSLSCCPPLCQDTASLCLYTCLSFSLFLGTAA